jgi:hypothetical protein
MMVRITAGAEDAVLTLLANTRAAKHAKSALNQKEETKDMRVPATRS